MQVNFAAPEETKLTSTQRIHSLCLELSLMREIRKVSGWYKGDAYEGYLSVQEGRAYVARQKKEETKC